jgi:hypothetical protein
VRFRCALKHQTRTDQVAERHELCAPVYEELDLVGIGLSGGIADGRRRGAARSGGGRSADSAVKLPSTMSVACSAAGLLAFSALG